jgi:hypothetical protein
MLILRFQCIWEIIQYNLFHVPLIIFDTFFVYLFIVARAIFQLSGACHHYRWQGCKFWPMFGAQGLWAGRVLYRATPTATRDLGLFGLIRKTGTYVPQWDSNPQHKDHQILWARRDLYRATPAVTRDLFLSHPKDRPIQSPLTTQGDAENLF